MSSYSNPLPVSFNPDDKRPLPELIALGNPDPVEGWPAFSLQFHDVEGVRYYAVQDWVRGVGHTENPRNFWLRMKTRLKKANVQLSPPCQKLPYVATDNKHYQLDFAPANTLWLITQSMSRTTGIVSRVLGYGHISRNTSREGYIYLIGLKELSGYVKIGKTRDVQKRIGEIGTNIPFEIILLHSFRSSCPQEIESLLHSYFQSRHVRREWFQLSVAEVEYMKQIRSDEEVYRFVGEQAAQASKRLGIDLVTNKPLLEKGKP